MTLSKTLTIAAVFTSLTVSLLVQAAAPKFKVPRLQKVGAFKSPVIAQTKPEFVQKKNGIVTLRRFYMSRLGVHRYEYGYVLFNCRGTRCEQFGDSISMSVFESCSGFKSNGKPNCVRLVSSRVDIVDPMDNSNAYTTRRTWFSCSDAGVNCERTQDQWDEYGEYHNNSSSEWDPRGYTN